LGPDFVTEGRSLIFYGKPSWRNRHLNLQEALPPAAERARISGTHTIPSGGVTVSR
jgi:hypothetical protein